MSPIPATSVTAIAGPTPGIRRAAGESAQSSPHTLANVRGTGRDERLPMIRRCSLVFVLASLVLAACGSGSVTPSPTTTPPPTAAGSASPSSSGAGSSDPAAIGRAFIAAMSRSDWAGAAAMEDPTMAAAAPASGLEQIGASLVTQYGKFQSIGSVTTAPAGAYTNVAVQVAFAYATVTLNVSVSQGHQVSGLHVGAVVTASTPPASYVKPGSFTETSVTVGQAPWTLPGTLTMPNGPGPFPAVVLVAGSGPADRNESFGPNKPFEDLAWGLASQGIAVLRYDKRTLVYAKQLAGDTSITVKQETMDDAEAAVALLRKTAKVDPARVFLVGHSLGAYLAPRIAAAIPGRLAGIALLEAPSTPLPQLVVIQEEYLASLQPSPSPQLEQQLATLKKQAALAESPDLSPSTPASELPLDTPASYWIDLQQYHPLSVAAALHLPMFFSQGGRDYQVPPDQLGPWEHALAGHTNVTFKTYPAMDHLLLDGAGPATPAEYGVPGHVDAQLVADLGAWILSH